MNKNNYKASSAHTSEENLWQAFLYVAGELSSDEAEAFEQRMLEDLRLCEAVAQATQLSCDIAATDISTASDRPNISKAAGETIWSSRRNLLATFAALCCLIVFGFVASQRNFTNESVAEGLGTQNVEAGLLVSAWAAAGDPVDDFESADETDGDLDVPGWMLAAVSMSELEALGNPDGSAAGRGSDAAELF